MSIQASILTGMMKAARLKDRLASRDLAELHLKLSLPVPPKKLARKNRIEKFLVKGVSGYWINKHLLSKGTIVYLHGGGFIYGPTDFQWNYITRISNKTGMAAVLIDYKKLPGYSFPHGLNDVLTIIRHWKETGELGNNWFMIGDSSGGGLCLSTSFSLRENGEPQPQKMILISPCLDINFDHPSLQFNKNNDAAVSEKLLEKIKNNYCEPGQLSNTGVSPIKGKMEGLPPLLLQAGTSEILLWDFRRFYFKCVDAGVNIRYEEYSRMPHVFATMNFLPEARKAQQKQVEFLYN